MVPARSPVATALGTWTFAGSITGNSSTWDGTSGRGSELERALELWTGRGGVVVAGNIAGVLSWVSSGERCVATSSMTWETELSMMSAVKMSSC